MDRQADEDDSTCNLSMFFSSHLLLSPTNPSFPTGPSDLSAPSPFPSPIPCCTLPCLIFPCCPSPPHFPFFTCFSMGDSSNDVVYKTNKTHRKLRPGEDAARIRISPPRLPNLTPRPPAFPCTGPLHHTAPCPCRPLPDLRQHKPYTLISYSKVDCSALVKP